MTSDPLDYGTRVSPDRSWQRGSQTNNWGGGSPSEFGGRNRVSLCPQNEVAFNWLKHIPLPSTDRSHLSTCNKGLVFSKGAFSNESWEEPLGKS